MFANRKYKSGTIWCFWRWTEVDSEYIVRLHLVKTPWFAICLHWINKADPEPYQHDHPVSFVSFILRGFYVEKRGSRIVGRAFVNVLRANSKDQHTIIYARRGTLTLCFMGPKTREWGFHTDDGWVMWKDYYAAKRGQAA